MAKIKSNKDCVSLSIGENNDSAEETAPGNPATIIEDTNNSTPNSISKHAIFLLATAFFLLGGIIGAVIGWTISDNTESDLSTEKLEDIEKKLDELISNQESDEGNVNEGKSNETKTDPPITTATAVPPTTLDREDLKSFIKGISPDGGSALNVEDSPQSNAFNWLWGEINNGKMYSNMQTTQRYALATLYYSTTGEGWTNNLGFLSNDSECSWEIYSLPYIPTWYGKMRHLEEARSACNDDGSLSSLSINNNDLSGTLPDELSLLTALKVLEFRGEGSMFGRIPNELGALSKLQHLAITGTQMTGQIPSEIGNMHLLDYLDLSNNFLTGSIPSELGQLVSLEILTINNNDRINGQLSSYLGNMKNAKSIDISQTSVTGVVPHEVCNIRRNKVSVIASCGATDLICCCCKGDWWSSSPSDQCDGDVCYDAPFI